MKKFIIASIFVLLASTAHAAGAAKNFCGTTETMLNADYWIRQTKKAHQTILTQKEIETLSLIIKKAPGTYCTDVMAYPAMLPRGLILQKMKNFSSRPQGRRYIGAAEAGEGFWRRVEENADTGAVKETEMIRFGVAVKNGLIKTLPCEEPLYSGADDILFDMNVESAVKIWEPLAVLHESADGEYFFVESPCCAGWIKKDGVALTDKKTLKELAARDFYVVTGSRVTTDIRTSEPEAGRREFFMGTKLPAADGAVSVGGVSTAFSRNVLVPERGADGSLRAVAERIPLGAELSHGYLPYTQANVIRQAFKMLGERYGWGGTYGSRDCSAFIRDIYLTFGIELPRNSLPQALTPTERTDAAKITAAEREKLLAGSPAGTLVQMPGHIMLYLGTIKGRPYIIHSVYALAPSDAGGADGVTVLNCVAVTDMEMRRRNGSRIIDNIANINIIR
ncbi:MAG: SH3 domain-containing protein [Cloacibacillus porcorum]|uniref:SH3 domain-containing protein n=1 Tax=Cloacibacillus porcorum TaxID=1197717 RepID=UPI0023F3F66E|nr:SH3 domain-containing protein [Cloacibacillus porcorum]MCD7878059.1 SH3 domain-containing protein [Cloacibacillus porcorum]